MNFDTDIEKKIPSAVRKILKRIREGGFEAWAVGGCVRDCLLGRVPADWDITTDAKPEQIKKLFKRTLDTGLQHGTVTVLEYENGEPKGYEVTTYRIDGDYGDGRHPDRVEFTLDLAEDLKRRDFTINAMAFAPGMGLKDLHGGMEDLAAGVIRCVGDARERFSEDALRMMRAIRFAAQLDARIEEKTWEAVKEMAAGIQRVSAERIRVELEKLLMSDHPSYFRLFYKSGLSAYFLPEWEACMRTEQENPHHCYNVGEHILHSLECIDCEGLKKEAGEEEYPRALRTLRLTMLLHDIAKPLCKTVDEKGVAHFKGHPERGALMAEEILRRLKYDNDTIRNVKRLVESHEGRFPAQQRALRRAMSAIGAEYFPLYFYLQEADLLAQSSYRREEKLERVRQLRALRLEILAKQQCLSLKDLVVKGTDLAAAGIAPGPEYGRILGEMLSDVLDEPEHNEKEYLLKKYVGTEE